MPHPNVIALSAQTGMGVDEWLQWLEQRKLATMEAQPA